MFGLCGCGSDSEADEDERRMMRMKAAQQQLTPQTPGPQRMMPPGMPASGMAPPQGGMPVPPRVPVFVGEVAPQHTAVPQGLEPQEYGSVTASNITMKTANYGGTIGQEENSSCSKPPSVDSADIIHRHPAAKYMAVTPPAAGAPPEAVQPVTAAEPAGAAIPGGSPESSEEEIRSSSSERAPTARSAAEEKKYKSDQRTTDTGKTSKLTREAENLRIRALFSAEENALRDGTVKSGQDTVGVRVLTAETITRRQYVYDMNVPQRMLESGAGKVMQAQGAPEQGMMQPDPSQQSPMGVPYGASQVEAVTSSQGPTSVTSVTDTQSDQVRIVVSCQSQARINKSSGNLAPSGQIYQSGRGYQALPAVEGYAPHVTGQYGPPPPSEYGPPAQGQYGPPLSAQYAPPTQGQNVPATTGQYVFPAPGQYGPPAPEQYAPRYPVYRPRPPAVNQQYSYSMYQAQPPPPRYQEPSLYRPGPVYWKYPDDRDSRQPNESRTGLTTGIYFDIGLKKPRSKAEPGKADVEYPKSISSLLTESSSSRSSSLMATNRTDTNSKIVTVPKSGSNFNSGTKTATGTNTKTNTKSNTNADTKTGSKLGYKARSKKDKEVGRKNSNTAKKPGNKHGSKSDSASGTKSSSNQKSRTNSDQRGSSLCKCGHDNRKCDKACNVPSQ